MSLEELERMAARGEEPPKKLTPPKIMLYHTLSALYAKYQLGKLTKEEAQAHKRQIITAYEKYNEEYERYIALCKQLQDIIRNGYNIGGTEVIPKNE